MPKIYCGQCPWVGQYLVESSVGAQEAKNYHTYHTGHDNFNFGHNRVSPPTDVFIASKSFPEPINTEVRETSKTGGQKGRKPEDYALIPVAALAEIARVYSYGATKYSAHQWRKGYPYGWSYSAAQRHLNQFWSGTDRDEESGRHHLAHAAFHLLALMTFQHENLGEDDRP